MRGLATKAQTARANKIYEVLVKLAGAPDRPIDRWQFASHLAEVEEKKRHAPCRVGLGTSNRFGGSSGPAARSGMAPRTVGASIAIARRNPRRRTIIEATKRPSSS